MPFVCHARLFIPGPLPGLNELLGARGSVGGFIPGTAKRVNSYGELKRKWTAEVQAQAMIARLRQGAIPPAHFTFLHYEQDKLRDPDNFCGGAQKLLLDALKDAKLMKNDGWRDVLGIRHHWVVVPPTAEKRQPVGVMLFAAVQTLELEQALEYAIPLYRRVEMIPRAAPPRGTRAARPKGAARVAR